jgi:stage IV sporulation protein FB
MRDPLTWSFPLGRLFGIMVRVHMLFPVFALGTILRAGTHESAAAGDWVIACGLMGLMLISVLLHEFGHCFGARLMDGDAREVLLWPLGGLASVEVPNTPRANFITAAAGPIVNLLLCAAAGIALSSFALRIPFNPLWDPYTAFNDPDMVSWQKWLERFFWINWILFLFNMCLVGFPMDAGRLLQCLVWPRLGYRQATVVAIYCGFICALLLAIYALVNTNIGVLSLMLALFIGWTCRQQFIVLEHGGEDSLFGYDFSQGYTSLERDQPPPRQRRRQSFLQRWLQRRRAVKMQRDLEQREADERRMDELLEKIQREGQQSLTDEERRFLTRVSAKYRNRQ